MEEEEKDKNTFLRFPPGAVFDLYADANGNQEYDPDDQDRHAERNRCRLSYGGKPSVGGYFIKESGSAGGLSPIQTLTIFPSQKMDRSQLENEVK